MGWTSPIDLCLNFAIFVLNLSVLARQDKLRIPRTSPMQNVTSNFVMTIQSSKYLLIFTLFVTIVFNLHGQTNKTKRGILKPKTFHQTNTIDTSKYAVISFNKLTYGPFDKSYKSAKLTAIEIDVIEDLLANCIAEYDSTQSKNGNSYNIIDLSKEKYKKQFVAVINNKGEKEVWINCFCDDWDKKWKTHILIVDDGGKCYFNLKINLTTKKYFDLQVNGEA